MRLSYANCLTKFNEFKDFFIKDNRKNFLL